MPDSGRYLAFDYGNKRIGIAVGSTFSSQAEPLAPCPNHPPASWQTITQLIKTWQPRALIIGLPLVDDGKESPMTKRCRRFAKELNERFQLPIHMMDERLTSASANHIYDEPSMRDQGVRKRIRKQRDSVAAVLILESFFHDNPTT